MTSSGSVVNHFGAVDETTKRLVGRCAQVQWLKDDNEDAGGSAVAKKLLGMENPSAMTSSLSVVEFAAAHKGKPGLRTPSHGGEGGRVGLGNGAARVDECHGTEKSIEQEKSPFEVEGEA
jgi:hypothetical protein